MKLTKLFSQVYYDYFSGYMYKGGQKEITVKAELHQLPLFVRGGSIIPTRERPRRSSPLMKFDPFTLRVALNSKNTARGELYLDDGETYLHETGNIIWREFIAESPKKGKGLSLSSRDLVTQHPDGAVDGVSLSKYDASNDFAKGMSSVKVERIVILGLNGKPSKITTGDGKSLDWEFEAGVGSSGKEGTASVLTIKNPGFIISADWDVVVDL